MPPEDGAGADDIGAIVLAAVEEVVAEVRGRHRTKKVSMASQLRADLGLDSLAIAEVLSRVEDRLGVTLPSSLLVSGETPRDLTQGAGSALGRLDRRAPADSDRIPRSRPPAGGAAYSGPVFLPAGARTLVEVLEMHAESQPNRVHLRLLGDSQDEDTVTYEDLLVGAARVAGGLQAEGLPAGGSAALMLPTGRAYFEAFLGVLLAGGVPVPIYPPARPSQVEEHLRRQIGILSNAGAALLVTDSPARTLGRLIRSSVDTLRGVVTVDGLLAGGHSARIAHPDPDDTALIQYTSGSTGDPKGVVLSHANLLANISAMADAAEVTTDDSFVSWLPLYHDMGLIGAWLAPLCLGFPTVIMSPVTFLAAPVRWLRAIDRFDGTVTAAPNFAYELCLRKVTDLELEGLDLSSLRLALNGAEPVRSSTMARFSTRFGPCGLRAEALAPVYGLAECALALTFPALERGLLVDTVDGTALQRDRVAVAVATDRRDALPVVACGRPLPGYQIRVTDPAGHEVADRTEGSIEFLGPSATRGYFRNQEATSALFHGGWVVTGDLGYLADGELYITGRAKDLIIRAGRNLHPEELEAVLGDIPGVRKGCVAVFASPDVQLGTEKMVVIAETRETDPSVRDEIRARIVATTVEILVEPPDEVLLAPPGAVLKTSSGKIRRTAMSELYQRGRVGGRPVATWWQLLRLLSRAALSRLRLQRRELVQAGYSLCCWTLVAAIGSVTLVALVMIPRLSWRRRSIRGAARCLRILSGNRLTVRGLDHLPAGPCVVVANHASWLDGPLLASRLPARFDFVAGELFRRQRVAGFLLRRIGSEFVERYEAEGAVSDAVRIGRLAQTHSLVMFPEGGLERAAGLRPFHTGAFMAAAQAGRPVVPMAIVGTRSMLRPGQRVVHRGEATLIIGDPIVPDGDDWSAALRLQQSARDVILRHCHEPDLA